MERVTGDAGAPIYRELLRHADAADATTLRVAADRFDAAARALPAGPAVDLLRARGAALLANVFPLCGVAGAAWWERALRLANPLRGVAELAPGSVDGVIAEAYLARCAAASSTALRTLYAHLGRNAARRALAANPHDVSANFAAGSFALHTPAVFGGSATRAARHFERVLAVEPLHAGARLLLARARAHGGRHPPPDTVVATPSASSPGRAECGRVRAGTAQGVRRG